MRLTFLLQGVELKSPITPSHDDSLRWQIRANPDAIRSVNPIRKTMQSMPSLQGRGKEPISLGLGDPSVFSGFSAPQVAVEAFNQAISSFDFNGYCLSSGTVECRRCVADYLSKDLPYNLIEDDIFMTAGCSQAIQYCIAALADTSKNGTCSNMLLPRPGFPLYESFCTFYGVQSRLYDLLPDQRWEIDFKSLEKQADQNTVAIVICNPGNPTGSVYSLKHLQQLARLAKKLRIPIISDEIYANIAFDSTPFIPMGEFASEVPVLSVGGISKKWFVPGWRLGWISVCDPQAIFKEAKVQDAIVNLANMQLSTATPVQAALPRILQDTPSKFFDQTITALRKGADLCYQRVQQIPGLSCPSKPQGSMYIMARLDCTKFKDLKNDFEFAKALAIEEALGILPGSAFGYPGWIRLLFAAPIDILEETWNRVEAFCERHSI